MKSNQFAWNDKFSSNSRVHFLTSFIFLTSPFEIRDLWLQQWLSEADAEFIVSQLISDSSVAFVDVRWLKQTIGKSFSSLGEWVKVMRHFQEMELFLNDLPLFLLLYPSLMMFLCKFHFPWVFPFQRNYCFHSQASNLRPLARQMTNERNMMAGLISFHFITWH